jgi:hypothetical protein
MATSNFVLNNRINSLSSQLGSKANLNSNNVFTGTNDFIIPPTTETDATLPNQLTNLETVNALIAGGGTNILNSNNVFTGSNDFSTICPTTEISASSAYQITNLDTVISAIYSVAPSILPLNNLFTGINTINNGTPLTITNTPDTNKKLELTVNDIHFTDSNYFNNSVIECSKGYLNIKSILDDNINYNLNYINLNATTATNTIKVDNRTINAEINMNLDHTIYSEINITAGQINIVPNYGNVNVGGGLGTSTLSFTQKMYNYGVLLDKNSSSGALNQVLVNDGTGKVEWNDQASINILPLDNTFTGANIFQNTTPLTISNNDGSSIQIGAGADNTISITSSVVSISTLRATGNALGIIINGELCYIPIFKNL